MRSYWTFILISLLFVACGPKGNVYIDNGGDEILTITVDQTPYALQAKQRTLIELAPGPHNISVKGVDGKVRREEQVNIVKGGLVNAAEAEFLIWKEVFAPQVNLELRKQQLKPEKLKVDNYVYEIEYTMLPTDQLYVEQVWDLGLKESFPKKVRGLDLEAEQQFMFKTLLVRKDEFPKVYLDASKP